MVVPYGNYYIYNGSIDGETPTETTSEYNKYYISSGADYTIVANSPATGMAFNEWETSAAVTVTDATSSTTTLTIPSDITEGSARATYHHAEKAYLDLDGLDVLATKVQKKINYGTTDLTPGVSQLDEGSFYFVYS